MAQQCWLPIDPQSGFTLQNIPFGIFSVGSGPRRIGTAVGEHIIDLGALSSRGLFNGPLLKHSDCFQQVQIT